MSVLTELALKARCAFNASEDVRTLRPRERYL